MSVSTSCIKLCLLATLVSSSFLCHAAHSELSQALTTSQARLHSLSQSGGQLPQSQISLSSSSWLNGLPSISLSHLGSLDNGNSYEQELSLNLPIKSPALHSSDKQIKQLAQGIQVQQAALQGLYLSGLLRQSLWEHRLAAVKLAQLDRKSQLLDKLHNQQKQLTDAGELPIAHILLLERELVDIALERVDLNQQQAEARALYQQLTGQEQIPQNIAETARPLSANNQPNDMLAQHPLWQLLNLQKQQQLLIIQSQQAGNNDPWAVSLTAKNTADNQVDDQQLGIAVSVPLTLGSALSQTELSQWQQANTEHTLNLDRTYIELKTQLKKLEQQQQNLLDQQTLLTQALHLSRTITEELAKVKDQNQVSYEVWLRRYMDALDTESRLALNQVAQQQLHSQQLQALGISL
ncbi:MULTISPECIES: metal transporter [unclassified Shewanella]|uniref:metal transporter n=1 Tax=unclassified Shewanella TaxID=196818 RepID=UPI0021DAF26F|nr:MULTISPECIES: metal transporter [unclassified Shewanella]MCU8034932.1 metal transporter [Shewanella sp. SM71]MCU8096801.1 metal transporter [Shewanella sp. SM102]